MLSFLEISFGQKDAPLKFGESRVPLNLMKVSGMGTSIWGLVVLSLFGFGQDGHAAPDFKIRYNPKFPCLEVMDGKTVKITDISEGTQGEVVTSGKASLKLSFLKNANGEPEVTMTDAKSTLSEMELEAFGLSVGMKPEGVVTVRFGADNKPQFEMDRTGGARFLMADLGNLDTAAGKEAVAAQPSAAPAGPSKGLQRFRERVAAWKTSGGKGGWSNRPGKVLSCGKQSKATITYTGLAARPLLDGEAIQTGAEVTVGPDAPVTLQSGPGIFQKALPGTKFAVAPLEAGQKDVKITLIQGTLLTMVMEPLVAPRMSLLGIGEGVVVQTGDATYQTVKDATQTRFSVLSGSVNLVEEAGAAQVARIEAGNTGTWPKSKSAGKLAAGSPEGASLKQLAEDAKKDYLVDMAEDAIKAASSEAEEIVRAACTAGPAHAREISVNLLEIRPDLRDLISQASGVTDLPASRTGTNEAEAFAKRVQPWLRAEPSPTSCMGRVLWMDGKATYANGLELKRGMILKEGETIKTSGDGRVILVAAPGVLAEIQPGSTVKLVEMAGRFEASRLVSAKAVLDASQGNALISIAGGLGEKAVAELRTPQGVKRAQSSPEKVEQRL